MGGESTPSLQVLIRRTRYIIPAVKTIITIRERGDKNGYGME
jgi:hypothetical protein